MDGNIFDELNKYFLLAFVMSVSLSFKLLKDNTYIHTERKKQDEERASKSEKKLSHTKSAIAQKFLFV